MGNRLAFLVYIIFFELRNFGFCIDDFDTGNFM